jgi:hypothetical protein
MTDTQNKKSKTVVPEEAPSQQMQLLGHDDSKSFHQRLSGMSELRTHVRQPGSRQQKKYMFQKWRKAELKKLGNVKSVSASELQRCVAAVAKDSKTYSTLLALPRLHVQAWEMKCASAKEAEHFVEFTAKTAISHIAANYKQFNRARPHTKIATNERKVMVVEFLTATQCLFAFESKSVYFMTDEQLFTSMQTRLHLSEDLALKLVVANALRSETFYIFVVSVGSKGSGFACMGTANNMESASQQWSSQMSSLIPTETVKQTCHYRCDSNIVLPCACKLVWYCSKECQKRHWKAGHNATCPKSKKNKNMTKSDPANHVEPAIHPVTLTSKDIQQTDPKSLATAKVIQICKARLQEALTNSSSDFPLNPEEDEDDEKEAEEEAEEAES